MERDSADMRSGRDLSFGSRTRCLKGRVFVSKAIHDQGNCDTPGVQCYSKVLSKGQLSLEEILTPLERIGACTKNQESSVIKSTNLAFQEPSDRYTGWDEMGMKRGLVGKIAQSLITWTVVDKALDLQAKTNWK